MRREKSIAFVTSGKLCPSLSLRRKREEIVLEMDIRSPLRFLQHENSRLIEENRLLRDEVSQLRRTVDVFCTLQEVSTSIDQQTDPLSLLDRILLEALKSIHATNGTLMLVDKEKQELVFTVVHGKIENSLLGYRIPIGVGVAGWVAKHLEPVRVKHAPFDSRFFPKIDENFAFQTKSMLCVPIALGDQILGVIQALNKSNREEFSETDLMLLGGVAHLAAVAISRAESFSLDTTLGNGEDEADEGNTPSALTPALSQ